MPNDTLFEILIYSCNQQEFNARLGADIDDDLGKAPIGGRDLEIYQWQRDDEYRRRGKSVRFNELIGSIEIYGFGSQLRADLWFTDKSRIQIGTKVKGKIRRRGKLLEKRYRVRHQSSREFFADFRLSLRNAIDRHRRLHGRYVDFRAFDRTGPYIDWRAILKPSITD